MFFIYVRMSIAQETRAISGLSFKKNKENIKAICNESLLRGIISSYPVNELEFRQKMFVRLIEWKMAGMLQVLAEVGMI